MMAPHLFTRLPIVALSCTFVEEGSVCRFAVTVVLPPSRMPPR